MSAIVFIPLTQGKVAVIDFDDFEKVRPYKWYARRCSKAFYAVRSVREGGKTKILRLHQLLMGPPPLGLEIGHKDGNGLNCRRGNLAFVTHQQNAQGPRNKGAGASSIFRGVSRFNKKWKAQLRFNNALIYLGLFEQEGDAARAYDKKATELFGEWASTNFPL